MDSSDGGFLVLLFVLRQRSGDWRGGGLGRARYLMNQVSRGMIKLR